MVGKVALLVLLLAVCQAKNHHSEKRFAEAKHNSFMKRQFFEPSGTTATGNGNGQPTGSDDTVDASGDGLEEEGELCSRDRNPCYGGECHQIGENAVRCGTDPPTTCDLACENGGVCVIDRCGNTRCQCPAEFEGRLCEETYDPCRHMSCMNGGHCEGVDPPPPPPPPPGMTGHYYRPSPYYMRQYGRCICPERYTGYRCDTYMADPIDEDITMSVGETRNIAYPKDYFDGEEDMYTNNVQATWNIHCDDENVEYVVTVNSLDTEQCCDHLRIVGGSEAADEIRPHWGYGPNPPNNRFSGCISAGQQLTTVVEQDLQVSFRTDMSVVRAGFNITIEVIPASDDPCCDNPCTGGSTCEPSDDGSYTCERPDRDNFRYSCDTASGSTMPFPAPPAPVGTY